MKARKPHEVMDNPNPCIRNECCQNVDRALRFRGPFGDETLGNKERIHDPRFRVIQVPPGGNPLGSDLIVIISRHPSHSSFKPKVN